MFEKYKRWRSKKYEEWVRTLQCAAPCCNQWDGVECHHAKGIGGLSGVGLKSPSWACMPLCRVHHDMIQRHDIDKEYQWQLIALTLGRAINEDILKI